jgi:hypothetical protein
MKHTMVKAAVVAFAVAPMVAFGFVSGTASAGAAGVPSHVTESMSILTGHMDHRPGWPKITNSAWTVHKGQTVTIKITSYDDGTAPLTGQYMKYDKVMGAIGGHETVNGKATTTVSDINVAHTFTVVGLGFNMPVPVAPTGGHVTVIATFVAKKTGTFVWHCFAPCGSGPTGMGGAMMTSGWMTGKVRVVA